MVPKLSENQRLKLIKRVVEGKETVSSVCREAGISRVVFYRWLKRYQQGEDVGPRKAPEERPKRRVNIEQISKIVGLALKHPSWSSHKISEQVEVSNHGVHNVLTRLGLNTEEKRLAWFDEVQGLDISQAVQLAKQRLIEKRAERREAAVEGGLSPKKRLEMIEQVVKYNKPVSAACRDFGVSRPTFYKWLTRYQEEAEEDKVGAMRDKEREVERYHGQVDQEIEDLILNVVIEHPEYGIRKILQSLPLISGKPAVGYHGVQNVLRRHDLSIYAQREAYASEHRRLTAVESGFEWLINRLKLVWDKFIPSLAPAPPPILIKRQRAARFIRLLLGSTLVSFLVSFGAVSWLQMLARSSSGSQKTGLVFASLALSMGTLFFLYSLKYYLTLAVVLSYSQREGVEERRRNGIRRGSWWDWLLGKGINGNGNGEAGKRVGLDPDLGDIRLSRRPKVAVHIPFYNEKKVVERAIEAATSFDYPDYEVILADDSTDETPEIIRKYQEKLSQGGQLKTTRGEGWILTEVRVKKGVVLKHIHRTSRSGFKGGALGLALKLTDPRVEFISVFDADFVPYPDTFELFLKYFKAQNGMREDYSRSKIAAVQGYQWHVLNKSENWVTRGVRSEYAGSYVIERAGTEIYGGLKQISGSVYMIRRDVLEELGWKTSITEDFQLTLRLYEKGYKVVYTPYIQAPAECVSTLRRLIRQRMRWAEGHSWNIKNMVWRLLKSKNLNVAEKLETIYLSPYYLQAFFFLVGTFCWLIAETVFPARLPFWTALWGWSLVLSNMISLPLMNAAGMFLEESEERDYIGIASFLALSYIVVPFQAYAAIKGFIQKEEGPWFRTPKTGRITDVFTRGKFYRFITGILPGRPAAEVARSILPDLQPAFMNKYVALATANSRFDGFRIKPRRMRWVSKGVVAGLLALTVTVYSATKGVPEVLASNPWGNLYLHTNAVSGCGGSDWSMNTTETAGVGSTYVFDDPAQAVVYWFSDSLPTEGGDGNTNSDTWEFYLEGSWSGAQTSDALTMTAAMALVDAADCTGASTEDVSSGVLMNKLTIFPVTFSVVLSSNANQALLSGTPKRIRLALDVTAEVKTGGVTMKYDGDSANSANSRFDVTGLTIPEKVVLFIGSAWLAPLLIRKWLRKKERNNG